MEERANSGALGDDLPAEHHCTVVPLCVINVIYYFCFLNEKCITSSICVHDCTHILTQVSSRGHISARHILLCYFNTTHIK